jgi:hypothetical protein
MALAAQSSINQTGTQNGEGTKTLEKMTSFCHFALSRFRASLREIRTMAVNHHGAIPNRLWHGLPRPAHAALFVRRQGGNNRS